MANQGLLAELFSDANHDSDLESCLLLVGFPSSKSALNDIAIKLIDCAKVSFKKTYSKTDWYVGGFEDSADQIEAAVLLLDLIKDWKFQVVATGRRKRSIYSVLEVLKCYRKALLCNDRKAHCFTVIDDPRVPAEKRCFVLPCWKLKDYFRYSPEHPSSFIDQLQAHAVDSDVEWCPFLGVGRFVESGVMSKLIASK